MNRTKQKAAVPKARCEFLIPDELDARLEAIRRKVGVSRTSLLVAAVEQFVYGEETRTGVDGLHERLAHMMVRLRADILEIRAHLDTAMQEDKRGDRDRINAFRDTVAATRVEILRSDRMELEDFLRDAVLAQADLEESDEVQ
jgi:hypothetical protein